MPGTEQEAELSVEETLKQKEGAFVSSLQRNNKKIRDDRALAIAEKTERLFKRTVEDLIDEIKTTKREREAMLDLSPSDAQSLVLASDFNEQKFVQKDLELGVKIRNLEIKLEVAEKRYAYLFGAPKTV